MSNHDIDQLALVPTDAMPARSHGRSTTTGRTEARRASAALAGHLPVAQVVIDTGLAHLDRPFEYAVAASDERAAQPGVRVRVRFAGRDHDGFVIARTATSEHPGTLTTLRRVVSEEVVLTPHIHRVCRKVADYYAGTLSDVLRLAVPPRHAAAEKAATDAIAIPRSAQEGDAWDSAWSAYPAGRALLSRIGAGESPAAALLALPSQPRGRDWPLALAQAAAATRRSGRGSVLVVPDHRDLDRVSEALDNLLGPGQHARLSADQGPSVRYASWLSVLRGHHDIVVGTRAAAYAPVTSPGLFAVWDDGDDVLRELRSPYPHIREVLRLRADDAGAALLMAGFVKSAPVAAWVADGHVRSVQATTATVRHEMPKVSVAGEGYEGARDEAAASARLPSLAWRAISLGLKTGPVLIQVPRRGYLLGLSCARCRHRIECGACHGPTASAAESAQPTCQWCGEKVPAAPCPQCGSLQRRGAVRGEQRTAYEIGRAFPGVKVHTSKAGQLLDTVPSEAAIVVATPGAEPVAAGGYAATVLLDGWALLDRAGLDSGIEALRRWSAAAALTRSGALGGHVVLAGVPAHGGVRCVEALVRWDPQWLVESELVERAELGLPPVVRTVRLSGETRAVDAALAHLSVHGGEQFDGLEVLGPTAHGDGKASAVLRLNDTHPRPSADRSAHDLLAVTKALRAHRTATKVDDKLSIVVDSDDLGA